MTIRRTARVLSAAAVLAIALAGASLAQQRPAAPAQPKPPAAQPKLSPASLLLAKELIDLKGAASAYDPLITGVIEYHKNFFMQNNPNLASDLDQVAQKLAADLAPRKVEMQQELTRIYASHFTEAELKDALAFYKSPLGRKIVRDEPKILDDGLRRIQDWTNRFSEEVMNRMRTEMKKKGYDL